MRKIIFFVAFSFSTLVRAQVGIGIKTSHPSAILHLEGKNKGVLFPKINIKERDALIKNPPEGLILYNPQNKCLEFWNGTNWLCIYGSPSPISLRLNCDQISVEGVFVENAISFPKITLDVNYDGLEEGQIGVTDLIRFENVKWSKNAVLFSSREGGPIGPNFEMPLTVTGGKDITVDHLGILPQPQEGRFVKLNISALGKTCPVRIKVLKESRFTVDFDNRNFNLKVIKKEENFEGLYPKSYLEIHPIFTKDNDTPTHSEVHWSIYYHHPHPRAIPAEKITRVKYDTRLFEGVLKKHKIDLSRKEFLDKKIDYEVRIYFPNGSYISKKNHFIVDKTLERKSSKR